VLIDTLRRRGFAVERHWRVDGPVPRGVLGCRYRHSALPNVLFVVDAPGWAHDRKAQNLCRELRGRYDGRIVYQDALTETDLDGADLVVMFYWRQLQSLDRLREPLARMRDKLLMGVCSHNELEGEFRSKGLAALRRLPKFVFTHSRLLESEVLPLVVGRARGRLIAPATIRVAHVGLHGQPDAEHGEVTVDAASDLAARVGFLAGLPAVQLEIGHQLLKLRVVIPIHDFTVVFHDRTELGGHVGDL
jgi:hypothetical protein